MKELADNTYPFRQTAPDGWYLHALIGYVAGFQKNTSVSAVAGLNESIDNVAYNVSSGVKYSNGFGAIVGATLYLNKNSKMSLFVSPEFFYSRLNLQQQSFSYNTGQEAIVSTAGAGTGVVPQVFKVPASLHVNTRNMYGFNFRFGLTFVNTVSIFGKASIGGLDHVVESSLNLNQTDWSIFNTLSSVERAAQITNVKTSWNNKNGNYYIGNTSTSKRKAQLMYGVGIGVETSFWNHHVLIRLDYDYYMSNGTVQLNNIFNRYATNNANTDRNRWKIKSRFSVFKITFGTSF